MNIYEIIGYMAGFFTAVCFLPQSIKTIKTRQTKDISALSYILYVLGMSCWTVYGIYLNSTPMILFNSISLIVGGSILAITLYNLLKKQ